MALFGNRRDINLFTTINKELLWDVIEQQVGYYKINLSRTNSNLYGESDSKYYNPPVLIPCLIQRSDQDTVADDFGPDINRNLNFAFMKTDLIEANMIAEIGDIIAWGGNYFEVDSVVENQIIVGKYPDYSLSEDTDGFGSSFSMVCYTHFTRTDKLNIEKSR